MHVLLDLGEHGRRQSGYVVRVEMGLLGLKVESIQAR